MKPRTQAIAFRIWAYCTPRGWDVTISDIAEGIDENPHVVRGVLQAKGWTARIRSVSYSDEVHYGPQYIAGDAMLSDLHKWS